MEILAESPNYILGHDYESVYVQSKHIDQEKVCIGDHYGDPKCGLIALDESWFLAAGEGLTFFDFQRGAVVLMRDGESNFFIHSMRLEDRNSVRILIDPWSPLASTWLLNIPDLKLMKLRDGPSLVEQPYQEDIEF